MIVIISAINLREGGTLSILNDFMHAIVEYKIQHKIDSLQLILLCHSKELLTFNYNDIKIITYQMSIKSYILRVYYEYVHFYFLSKKLKPDVWFSLHDVSPNVCAKKKYVYCHNSMPFFRLNFKMFRLSWRESFFSCFYKYVYKINIKNNSSIFVQQQWLAEAFSKKFMLNRSKIVVARPILNHLLINNKKNNPSEKRKNVKNITKFIFPSFPRTFKNFEGLFRSVIELNKKYRGEFEAHVTISGSENSYSHYLKKHYGTLEGIVWLGLLPRAELIQNYRQYDALVFPSLLETFGLPLEEFKYTNNPIIVIDLPYARESIGNYEKTIFFNPLINSSLFNAMEKIIKKEVIETQILPLEKNFEELKDWGKLVKYILKN
jgi:glycosyltransferase involved in cell wall biosynthesis